MSVFSYSSTIHECALYTQESRPLYKELEGVIESMVEFITLRGEMIELPRQHYCEGDEQKLLHKTK